MARMDWNRNRLNRLVENIPKKKESKERRREIEDALSDRVATYCRLEDGSWGLRVEGNPIVGSSVVVRKKDGTKASETVGRVLRNNGYQWYCTIQKS